MQMVRLWHARARNALPEIHTTRLRSLFAAVSELLLGRQLWLTGVGRHLATNVSEKHQIKRVDRLLGNIQFHAEHPKTRIGAKIIRANLRAFHPSSTHQKHKPISTTRTTINPKMCAIL